MSSCIVFACDRVAWRRNLCRFHHHQRSLYTIHCTKHRCYKPIFKNTLLCKYHFRREYATCLVPNCSNITYTTHLCRKHYDENTEVSIPSCPRCDRPVFALGLCAVHVVPTSCKLCDQTVLARGMCSFHYFKDYRKKKNREEEKK